MSVANVQRPWYRESWPWLLMLPPAASVVAGVALLWFAVREPAPLVIDDYSRIEEISHDQDVADRNAARRGLAATLALREDGNQARVAVAIDGDVGDRAAPLTLRLRHAGNASADRVVALHYDGRGYAGSTNQLAVGRYDFEVAPADFAWRLTGAVGRAPTTVRVVAGE